MGSCRKKELLLKFLEGCVVPTIKDIHNLTREQLIDFVTNLSKQWLAHDGLWFQAVEKKYGLANAMELDAMAWKDFVAIEAKRIKQFLDLPEQGGLDALELAMQFRLYTIINQHEIIRQTPNKLIFYMNVCRVQMARERKKMPLFPCKSVGLLEYSGFASHIDSRINTQCICCPPEKPKEGIYCAWEFSIDKQN